MEIITCKYYTGSRDIVIEIPKYCPNCGIGNNPKNEYIASINNCTVYSHFCNPCKKYHYSVQDNLTDSTRTLLLVYPNKTIVDIDPVFIEHAPRFVEFYSEAVEAEKLGLVNIAGTGYRSAIECLIKDYALHFELDDAEYLSNPRLTFNNAIDRYVKDDDLLKGALHFIREIGNHYTHWSKETDIPLSVLKSYVEIIIQIFKSKFMLKHLPS
ncbi:DUF4145 domain-containing protein [Streptococcus moroccensis]|uniref:DUF4145 domain-containing protein n=1 Tax=Streptococcus moroccensis TaxID=1451356 RepID=A0ABT9YNZ2_9STRE|nr:DUF4145 domain-containing protein [Streptococcus moroccensis]MDQ0221698.1 hypothetical protein [Streptococcus moroccensis]